MSTAPLLIVLACSTGAPEKPDPPGPPDRTDSATDTVETGPSDTAPPSDSDSPLDTGFGVPEYEQCQALWSPGPTPPRNLLVISIDTLRRDYLGAYSAEATASPFIDSLLAEGLVLDDHRSCSNWTYASILCALSGRYNEENAIFPRGGDPRPEDTQERVPEVPDSMTLMPDVYREQGFISGLITANTFLGRTFNVGTRYDRAQNQTTPADGVTLKTLEIADLLLADGRPWLLHAHYIDPHSSYNPPNSYVLDALAKLPDFAYQLRSDGGLDELAGDWANLSDNERAVARQYLDVLYEGEIRFMDDQIKRLFDALDVRGMLDDTLVMIWSDHGEQFYEHGGFRHHKDLYNEETAGLAGFWTRSADTAARWSGATTHVDLLPTALCLMGLPPYEGATGAPAGTAQPGRPRFASVLKDSISQASVDQHDLRLLYRWSGPRELYDRSTDPNEQNNLASERTEELEALWALLEPMVRQADEMHTDEEATLP